MTASEIQLALAPELLLFAPPARRLPRVATVVDGSSSVGHVVESAGVPLTEVGRLLVDGAAVSFAHVPRGGELVEVFPPVRRAPLDGADPTPGPEGEPAPRFLLDVHLGTLARRLRLLGVDAAYDSEDPGDPALAARSAAERRVLLSRDRGLLRRREIHAGAYVYSDDPEEQLDDVLSRFAPPLLPWTRCTACNGALRPADKDSVGDRLEGGTQRSYDVFAECGDCARVYWRGAHHARLEAIVEHALSRFGPSVDRAVR
ncbi:Mut7-C RNAse domain-containing protein [Streptomyces sp. BI20]|uniref:Mut7-C RNAse domain-containing protein n=1 Tax=Streptomyces sp. BI20 TaxID=3403460 RepID=UPI003C75A113